MDYNDLALKLHKKNKGKISIISKVNVKTKDDLSWTYTPGVAAVSKHLEKNPQETNDYTYRGNLVAVISDGSAVLGLGNIGPEGAYPVMEGKALLFKHFAGIDSIPIVLNTQDPDEIIKIVKAISPSFGGINLEDIASPQCFRIEEELKEALDMPVVHDDQWGTAVTVLAGLINSLKIVSKQPGKIKVVITGTGAAGTAVLKILLEYGVTQIVMIDSQGSIYSDREDLPSKPHKEHVAKISNPNQEKGELEEVIKNADVFIGLSQPGILKPEMVKTMNEKPIIFALANPIPEIMPDLAKEAGAYIVATGRSDFNNQLNNALAFPGIFKGALDNNVKNITMDIMVKVAEAIANVVSKPTPEKIIPSIFDNSVVPSITNVFE